MKASTEHEDAIPACPYCDVSGSTGRNGQGSLDPESNKDLQETCSLRANEGTFENECTGECRMAKTVNRYTLVRKGDAACFANWAVASTMGNNVSFSQDFGFCWTSADVGSSGQIWASVSSRCAEMSNFFQRHLADFVLALSVIIGLFGSVIACWLFFGIFYPDTLALSMATMLTQHTGTIRQVSKAISWSRYFCCARHWTEKVLDEQAILFSLSSGKPNKTDDDRERLLKETMDELAKETGAIGPQDEIMNTEVIGIDYTWRPRWWFSGKRSAFEKMNVKDLVTPSGHSPHAPQSVVPPY